MVVFYKVGAKILGKNYYRTVKENYGNWIKMYVI